MKKVLFICFFLSSSIYVSAQTTRNCCTQTVSSEDKTFTLSITRCSSGPQTSQDAEEYIANCLKAEADLREAIAVISNEV